MTKKINFENISNGFLIKHPRYPDESDNSYLFRLAKANGCNSVDVFNYLNPIGKHATTKYCTKCLSEHPYFKLQWENENALYCEEHQCWLTDTCPDCSSVINYNRDDILTCRCGQSITREICHNAEAGLLKRINWAIGNIKVIADLPKLTKDERIRLTYLLGAYALSDGENDLLHKKHGSRVGDKIKLIQAGLSVLESWPKRYNAFLDDLYWRSNCALPKSKESNLFRSFMKQLFITLKNDLHSELVQKTQDFTEFMKPRVLNKRHKRMSEDRQNKCRWRTVKQTSYLLGIGQTQALAIIRQHKLYALKRETVSGRMVTLVDILSIDKHLGKFGRLLTAVDSARILGVTKSQFRAMKLKQMIRPAFKLGKKGEKYFYSEIQLKRLQLELFAKIYVGQPSDAISLSYIAKHFIKSDFDIVCWVLKKTLSGELHVYHFPSLNGGISSLRWSKQQIAEMAIAINEKQKVTQSKIATALNIKTEVVRHLMLKGVLSVPQSFNNADDEVSKIVSAFNSTYVTAAEIAKKNQNQKSRWLSARLKAKGVLPSFGPSIDGCRQIIFCRKDVPIHLLSSK